MEVEALKELLIEKERRLQDEDTRLGHRIQIVEEKVDKIGDLTLSVSSLAASVQSMAKEMEKQGNRLQAIEARDGEKWRKAIWYVFTALLGAIVAIIAQRIGLS